MQPQKSLFAGSGAGPPPKQNSAPGYGLDGGRGDALPALPVPCREAGLSRADNLVLPARAKWAMDTTTQIFRGLHLSLQAPMPHRHFAQPVLPFAHPPPNPNLPKQRGCAPPEQVPHSGHRLCPRRWQPQGTRVAQASTAFNAATSHQVPQNQGMEPERCAQLPCKHHGSRPGWQGWICTKRREEERAKVELTYRWLFKSIKGR